MIPSVLIRIYVRETVTSAIMKNESMNAESQQKFRKMRSTYSVPPVQEK